MGRWLGVDHGQKRIGIAVGSTTDGIASPLKVIVAEASAAVIEQIVQIAREYGAEGVVVGWPLNMDDSEGPQGQLARKMAVQLEEAADLDVRLWDERLSSFDADQKLAGLWTRKKKKARQDAVAAATILQDFFANGGPQGAPKPGEITS